MKKDKYFNKINYSKELLQYNPKCISGGITYIIILLLFILTTCSILSYKQIFITSLGTIIPNNGERTIYHENSRYISELNVNNGNYIEYVNKIGTRVSNYKFNYYVETFISKDEIEGISNGQEVNIEFDLEKQIKVKSKIDGISSKPVLNIIDGKYYYSILCPLDISLLDDKDLSGKIVNVKINKGEISYFNYFLQLSGLL